MPDRTEQAEAYLSEAETTLDGARLLFEHRDEGHAQVVKNAYDALEQALSAGIAYRGEDIPKYHNGKVTKFFGLYEDQYLERKSLKWLSKRETAQYVDFERGSLSVPEEHFTEADAEEVLEDAEQMLEFVKDRTSD